MALPVVVAGSLGASSLLRSGGTGRTTVRALPVAARPAPAPAIPATEALTREAASQIVAVTRTPSGAGYWTVTAGGTVRAHGDAVDLGAPEGLPSRTPVAGMAATPDGHGYWITTTTGRVLPFGDARFHGSLRGTRLRSPIVGIASAPGGRGYVLASADGSVHTFGHARWRGSLRGRALRHPVVGVAMTGDGRGYWLATADGGVWGFGDARFRGSLPRSGETRPVVAITASPGGDGYWLTARDGAVYAFGDAYYAGSAAPVARSAAVLVAAGDDPVRLVDLVRSTSRPAEAVEAPATTTTTVAPTPTTIAPPVTVATPPSTAAPTTATPTTATPTTVSPLGPGRFLGAFTVTCYDNYGTTASGATTSMETVAVDPSVIPMGSSIDIAGVGVRVAQDTGGAIIGDRLDIWLPSEQACIDWGVQTEDVWATG